MIGKIVAWFFLIVGVLGVVEIMRQAWFADKSGSGSFGLALVLMFFALVFLFISLCSLLCLIN